MTTPLTSPSPEESSRKIRAAPRMVMAGASRLARLAVRPGRGRREEAMAARRRGTFLLGRRRVLPVHGEEGGAQARGGGSQWRQLACRSMGPLASGFSAHCDDGRALHRWAEAVNPIAWRRAGIQHRINQAQQLHPQGRSFGRRSSSESNARLPAGAENGNVLDTSHSCIRSTR
jgi:hypothetical protein